MTTSNEAAQGRNKLSLPELWAIKRRGQKIAMVTAYDAPSAQLADAAGLEIVLVGDSAAMTVLDTATVPPPSGNAHADTSSRSRCPPADRRG